jgi:2-(1,2-epoxy-1,2-dihydrophenyl)acetyl-CoA isomerase
MNYENIMFKIQNGIAVLTLNRPDKLNSFTQAMHFEVRDALTDHQGRSERARAGADRRRARLLRRPGPVRPRGRAGRRRCRPRRIGRTVLRAAGPHAAPLPMPVICAVNGVAAGAGANLALACDIVLAARSASFVEAFCKLGLIPDSGGTWHLPRLIGLARATGLAMLGEKLTAERAEQWGLIWKCLPDAALMVEAMSMAEHFATAPTKGLAYTKKALQFSFANSLPSSCGWRRR